MFKLLHMYHPQPIAMIIGPFVIRWYGFFLALGALVGIIAVVSLAEKYKIKRNEIYDLAFFLILFGLIGARLYYILYGWSYYSTHPLDMVKIWEGGLAIYGAVIFGILVIYYFAKNQKLDFWRLLDVTAVGLVVGQIIGRFGNYFNQELFGKPTTLPWGIPIDQANRPARYANFQYFHPTFLYEILLNILLLAALLLLHRYSLIGKKKIKAGTIAFVYLIGYGLIRIFTETLRTDSTPFVFGIRWQMLASGLLIAASVIAIILRRKK